jgi:hypothetical protein
MVYMHYLNSHCKVHFNYQMVVNSSMKIQKYCQKWFSVIEFVSNSWFRVQFKGRLSVKYFLELRFWTNFIVSQLRVIESSDVCRRIRARYRNHIDSKNECLYDRPPQKAKTCNGHGESSADPWSNLVTRLWHLVIRLDSLVPCNTSTLWRVRSIISLPRCENVLDENEKIPRKWSF